MTFPLRFPKVFDGKLLAHVVGMAVITLVTAPGDGEVTMVTDETIKE